MRRFRLVRDEDVSGVSGTGLVAEGCTFSDGHVALHWLGRWPATTGHEHIDAVYEIHGHEGLTRVVWLDTEAPVE
jgi:hypothetical protein